MVYSVAILTNLLLAVGALAAPAGKSGLAARVQRRREGRQSHPMHAVAPPKQNGVDGMNITKSHTQYSSNWAGSVYDNQPSGTFTAVTGTFVVPTPQAASGQSSGSASAWVGIDGDTCGNAILQTGVDFTVTNGDVSYDAWYEWYPDYAYDFSNIDINSGDTVTVTVTSSGTTSGEAVISNLSTGKTVTQQLSSSSALCQENAEWIVEDYEEGGGLVTMANFGTVTFTDAYATTSDGGSMDPTGADTIDIMQNNQVVTSVSTSSGSCTVQYV